ncbi:MAG: hypothetical protein R3E47_05680 [Paracoccaceae bacterium]
MLVAKGHDVEVVGDIAGFPAAIDVKVAATDIGIGDLGAELDVVAFFEQDGDRLGRTALLQNSRREGFTSRIHAVRGAT